MRYRIKQYPEDTFIVQYKSHWFSPLWISIKRYYQGNYWEPKRFADLAAAKAEIDKQKVADARLAFKPVYYDY